MGVGIVSLWHLPFPASIVGLLLLLAALMQKIVKVEYIQDGAGFLISILTLFFIPATVGIIDYPELVSIKGMLVVISVIVSTLLAIYVTGVVTQFIEKRERKEE
ncbi:putative integral membrane protein YxzK [Lysinibacillus piscis]|uniref:Integral membrane protein YxzK n=2 Tax=Lysinibacillus piscis TaxID=2518931 RepID=A0ABQ5NHP3_9BACI|nr:putative integral membrane protein YxzK [Lysinibacillus sp. KH24]